MSNGAGMKIAGIAGVLVVLAGGCGAAYAFSDTVKNQVKLAVSSPEDYYEWVYEKNTNDVAALFENSYQNYSDRLEGSSGEVVLQFAPTEDAKAFLIEDSLGSSGSQMLTDWINGINSLELAIESNSSDSIANGTFKLRRNDTDVTSMEIAADLNADTAFMRIPDLTQRWLGMDLSDALEDADMGTLTGAPAAGLEPSEIAACVAKYSEILYENAGHITLNKKESVRIAGFTTEYTAITAAVSANDLLDRMIRLTDTASTDAVLKQLFPEETDFSGMMLDAGDELRGLRDSGLAGSGMMNVITYVDMTGTIRGYYIKSGNEFSVFCANGMKDKQVGAELQMTVQGTNLVDLEASATADGGSFTGTLKASVNNGSGDPMNISASFTDLEVVDAEKGYFNGLLKIDLPEIDTIELTFSSDGSAQNISYPLVVEDMAVGDLTLRYTIQENGSATMPDTSDAYQMDMNGNFELGEYITEAELEAYVTGVMERLGFSSEDAAQFGELAGAALTYY